MPSHMTVQVRPGAGAGQPRCKAGRHRLLAVAGATLLLASGLVHLYLYFNGYGPVPTIGTLFLVQFGVCLLIAPAILATGGVVAPAAGALFALATLGGYLLSLTVELFGFKEVPTSYGALAGALEVATFAALSTVALSRLALDARAQGAAAAIVRRAQGTLVAGLALAAALALALELLLVSPVAGAGAAGARSTAGAATVVQLRLAHYGEVLATPGHVTLYLLSDESPGHITCNSGCLSIWPPLLLPPDRAVPRGAPGVRGRLGTVDRGNARQVTYNGFPLYTYAGDPGPAGSAGQGIASYGGTWYMVRAAAMAHSSTPVKTG